MVYNVPQPLQQLFLPPSCLLCNDPGEGELDLCTTCLDNLPSNHHACSRCALPLPEEAPAGSLCGHCSRTEPPFHRIVAPWRYEGPLAELIRLLKFRQKLAVGRSLGILLARQLKRRRDRPQLILPVPLHPRQLRERGFNHAAELAYAVSRELELPWSTRLLRKRRPTPAQHDLDRGERLENLRGAFHFIPAGGYRHVAVVDDVVTTGATVTEVARTLKRAGVEKVEIWAVARTPDR